MPNPLARLGTPNQSRRQDAQHPAPQYEDKGAITPEPEAQVGEVFAYRGTETHGVTPTEHYRDPVPEYDATAEIEYAAEPKEPEPVPVYVVSRTAREFLGWRVNRHVVPSGQTGAPTQIAARLDTRRTMRIRNLGTVTIWINEAPHLADKVNGYPIPSGTEQSFGPTRGEVFATSDDGTPQSVAVLQEYSVQE